MIGVLSSSVSALPLSCHGWLPLDSRAVATTTIRIEDYDLALLTAQLTAPPALPF
jgi:hypothetical protein